MAANGRKSIFITGAASGIGLACAKRFAAEGWFVGLSDIDQTGLKAALLAIGAANGSIHPLDVRDREGWENALGDFGRETGGKADVLLNNAGVARFGVLEEGVAPSEQLGRLLELGDGLGRGVDVVH